MLLLTWQRLILVSLSVIIYHFTIFGYKELAQFKLYWNTIFFHDLTKSKKKRLSYVPITIGGLDTMFVFDM